MRAQLRILMLSLLLAAGPDAAAATTTTGVAADPGDRITTMLAVCANGTNWDSPCK